jgi:hypothetical protein
MCAYTTPLDLTPFPFVPVPSSFIVLVHFAFHTYVSELGVHPSFFALNIVEYGRVPCFLLSRMPTSPDSGFHRKPPPGPCVRLRDRSISSCVFVLDRSASPRLFLGMEKNKSASFLILIVPHHPVSVPTTLEVRSHTQTRQLIEIDTEIEFNRVEQHPSRGCSQS